MRSAAESAAASSSPLRAAGGTLSSLGLTYYQAALTNRDAIARFAEPLAAAAELIGRRS